MFDLPHTTVVNRVVPKNSFDAHINSKQKKLLSTHIDKIVWANKLSKQTIKLEGKDVYEIQIFTVQLKQKLGFEDILTIIDKYIPYHIIIVLNYSGETLYTTAQKHLHPTVENVSVIDWRFTSAWFREEISPFQLVLKNTLDDVFSDFCFQLSGKTKADTLQNIVAAEQRKAQLVREIEKLESEIRRAKTFKIKVELNVQLQVKKKMLDAILSL